MNIAPAIRAVRSRVKSHAAVSRQQKKKPIFAAKILGPLRVEKSPNKEISTNKQDDPLPRSQEKKQD
mgnify:CR=1 FL=1